MQGPAKIRLNGMRQDWTGEFGEERASIDGRVAFASAFLVLGCALIILLDRIGVPERLVAVLGPLVALVSLAILGALLHSMRISRFYAAGRRVPAIYAGFAAATLIAALAAACLVALPQGVSLLDFAVGLLAGTALAGLGVRPFVRKTGAFSLTDLVGARFPGAVLRVGVAVLIAAIAFAVAHAGVEMTVRALNLWSGFSRPLAAALTGIVLVLLVTPGGFAGAIWGAVATGAILIAAFTLPLIALMLQGNRLPFPFWGDVGLWDDAVAQLTGWRLLGSDPGSTDLSIIVALAVGLAVLVPVVAPAFAAPDRRSARRAGYVSLIWLCLFAGLAAVTIAASSISLVRDAVGQKPDRLSPALYGAAKNGAFTICGAEPSMPMALRQTCTAQPGFKDNLRASDLAPRRDFLFASLPLLAGIGSAFSGLVAAALAALGIALAGVGFHACATALGHDAFHRVRDAEALTSRRLAITRMLLIVVVVGSTAWASTTSIDPRAAIGLALLLSVAALVPLISLVLWSRASALDALVGLVVGLVGTEATLIMLGGGMTSGHLASASLCGAAFGVIAGILASLVRGGDRELGAAFVRTMLHGKAEMPNLDRGA
jgi:cation/acetate symporter